MRASAAAFKIEQEFRTRVKRDKNVKSAFLLVDSDKLDIHLNIAEGGKAGVKTSPQQPNHMASVGKLFTATLIGMLYEEGKLNYTDSIGTYLDAELMKDLLVIKGHDFSHAITIRHLLMQTSGLNDVFYHLWKKMQAEPGFEITPREAVLWGKKHLKPVAKPGKKFFYTDTNYYLLGLITEQVTGKKFHEVMHEYIFDPVGMTSAFMYGFSSPKENTDSPVTGLYMKGVNFLTVEGVHQIDYAGGSVVAPPEDFLRFMKALVNGKLIKPETLNQMLSDDINMGFPTIGFNYGYSIWKFKNIPFLMPSNYYSWGCVGVTGAFMFYHQTTESYLIGTFNDYAWRGKALEFMARKVIRKLLKVE